MNDVPKIGFGSNPTLVKNTTIVAGIALFFITLTFISIFYTGTAGNHITNTPQSEDKITILEQAMQSVLGSKWPYVLLIFTVLLGLLLYFLYLASSKESLVIQLSEQGEKRFNILITIFLILFGIAMIILVVKQYLEYKKEKDTGDIPNYVPSLAQQKQNMQILAIIGLGLFVLVGGGYGVWYLFSGRKT